MHYPDDDQDPPICPDCGAFCEAEADVDIDAETGRPTIIGVSAVCTNRHCPEPPPET
jgi:hypothetical protein